MQANRRSPTGRAIFTRPRSRRIVFLVIVLSVVALVLLGALFFANPQWSRHVYLARRYWLAKHLGSWVKPERPPHYSGVWREWHEEGTKVLEDTYVKGIPHGGHSRYDFCGTKREDGTYDHGKRHGRWKWWDINGRLNCHHAVVGRVRCWKASRQRRATGAIP